MAVCKSQGKDESMYAMSSHERGASLRIWRIHEVRAPRKFGNNSARVFSAFCCSPVQYIFKRSFSFLHVSSHLSMYVCIEFSLHECMCAYANGIFMIYLDLLFLLCILITYGFTRCLSGSCIFTCSKVWLKCIFVQSSTKWRESRLRLSKYWTE
jgi:hypothetical protein